MAGQARLQSADESDFSFRKIKLATIILIAQMFATSMLPYAAIMLVMMPMTKELGWTPTQFSFATTALMWAGGLTNPFYGRYFDSVGVRLPIMIGTLGVAAATFALAFQGPNLWTFYLAFAVLGMAGSSAIGYTKLVGALFTQHRGKAYAILGLESTIAGAGLPMLINWLITDYGWRGMFLTCSAIIVALLPVLYFTLDEPGMVGGSRRLFARRAADGTRIAPLRPPELEGMTGKAVMRDRVFWLIVLATIIASAPRSGMQPYLVPMLSDKGFGQSEAVIYAQVMTMSAPLGTIIAGWAVDRFQTSLVAFPFNAISFLGLLIFSIASATVGGWWVLMFGVALSGFAFGSARPITTYFHVRFFGLKSFAFYFGVETMLMAFTFGLAAPGIGYLAQATGGYDIAYRVMLAALALGAVVYLFIGKYRFSASIGAAGAHSGGGLEASVPPIEEPRPLPARADPGAARVPLGGLRP